MDSHRMADELDRLMTAMRAQPGIDSPAGWVASLSPDQQLQWIESLSDRDVDQLDYLWPFWARIEQLPPAGDWRFWLFRGGRGGGKTRAGAEAIRGMVEEGRHRRIALV